MRKCFGFIGLPTLKVRLVINQLKTLFLSDFQNFFRVTVKLLSETFLVDIPIPVPSIFQCYCATKCVEAIFFYTQFLFLNIELVLQERNRYTR